MIYIFYCSRSRVLSFCSDPIMPAGVVSVYQNALHLPDSMVLDTDEPIDYGVRVPWMLTHSEQCRYSTDANLHLNQ